MASSYRGRFAPSPTGPLHFGSLVAAVGSWLDARHHGGEWLVRIEDIDEARTIPGADEEILRTLVAYGLHWDGDVVWQTRRKPLYEATLDQLGNSVFACGCSRKEAPDPYPGNCRNGLAPGRVGRTLRLRIDDDPIEFVDRRAGAYREVLSETCGDFILRRADGLHAYQLAVVVDDAAQGISDIVRGEDLLDSTARQIYLQRRLGVLQPRYLHLPIATGPGGEKLSKQTGAPPVPQSGDPATLARALRFLGIAVPAGHRDCPSLLTGAIPLAGCLSGAPGIQLENR